jgi:hypothetical protein
MTLDPGNRRVLKIETTTVAFGDPAYDRQLASQTASDTKVVLDAPDTRFLLALDRRYYDLGSSALLAAGAISSDTALFEKKDDCLIMLRRIPAIRSDGFQPPPELLKLMDSNNLPTSDGTYRIDQGQTYELPIRQLARLVPLSAEDAARVALEPGDRLEVSVIAESNKSAQVLVFVDIVSEPVVAPPPAVYSFVEVNDGDGSATVPLHAVAPLPQKFDYPDLATDLARGHVRRRALFVWTYGRASNGALKRKLALIKFDRSGGAQMPSASRDMVSVV